VGKVYQCEVTYDLNITTEESAVISEVGGIHDISKSNDDVFVFVAHHKTIQFFPRGLDKFFKNIKAISIQSCQLKEIHQSDLKVFPNLVYVIFSFNQIEVIEEGLFDFNPNLEAVGFVESKIIHIDSNVFDRLTKLRYIWVQRVPCIDQNTIEWKENVPEAIKIVKSNCTNVEFLLLDWQIKNLEIESKAFNTKLETFQKILKNSKLSKVHALKYKFEIINNERCLSCRQIAKIEN